MKTIHVSLPDKEYCLYPEQNTIQKYGWVFPSEFENRTLFVTGISGTGKSTFVKSVCRRENIPYFGQTFVLLNEHPTITHSSEPDLFNLTDLIRKKIIDGHFLFPAQDKHGYTFAHKNPTDLTYNFSLGEEKNNLLFEFRQLDPTRIQQLIRKRHEAGMKYHTFNPTLDEIKKAETILYETAHKLFELGADVYIRRGLNGIPWRFAQ